MKAEKLQRARNEAGRAPALNAQGIELLKENKLDPAASTFREALSADPTFAVAAHNLALALGRSGKTMEAIEAFRTAIRLNPTFAAAHQGLGVLLRKAGDPLAEEELQKAQLLKQVVPQPVDTSVER